MIKLNDDSIIVGQIKQLLHNFNLPTCCIVKSNDNRPLYLQKGYIIKDDSLYYKKDFSNISNENFQFITSYMEGNSYLNITDTLDIENKYYDVNTHIYLGKYLRFLRDYHNINLMSMYNCSINKILDKDISFTYENEEDNVTWSVIDNDIYIVPVSPTNFTNDTGTEYTIYVKDNFEVTPVIYNAQKNIPIEDNNLIEYYNTNINSFLYKKCNRAGYCQSNDYPYLYDLNIKTFYNILNEDYEKLYNYKDYFCLLIKVSKGYDGPIVVLEGNYTNKNKGIIQFNNKNLTSIKYSINKLINPQLLNKENNNNYLLADRLIEYLTDNAITAKSKEYDIEKVRKWLTTNIEKLKLENKINIIYPEGYEGIWSLEMTFDMIQLYYYYLNIYPNSNYYDFIGYCDSTMEKLFEELGKHDEIYDYGGIL